MEPAKGNEKPPKPSNHQVHMANERTFLAWIRTSIGLIAFGFVVEKFSFFIKKLSYFLGKPDAAAEIASSLGYSSIFGIVLVGMGGVMGLMAFFRFKQVRREIEDDAYQPSLILDVMAGILIFAIGSFFVIYMIHSV
jgi:uncharacterized membrane protein YidH (DUF202 family)